jgi:hypothetical protein
MDLLQNKHAIKFSQVFSHVSVRSQTNVSEASSVSVTLVFDLALTRLNTQENFIALIRCGNFKSYTE